MKPIKNFFEDHGREVCLVAAGLLLAGFLLWFRLGSLTYGNAAPIEVTSRAAASSWQAIIDNPLNAPYTVVQRLVLATGHDGVTSMRLVSTLWALVALFLFYLVARGWHSTRVAALATWLFISSAWFLHTARLASPEIMWLVGILALVVLLSPNKDGRHNRLALPVTVLSLSVLLYIPAMVWLVALGIILRRKNIAEAWEAAQGVVIRTLTILGSLALLTPLVWTLVRDNGLLRAWAGFAGFEPPLVMLKQFLSVPKQLFISGPLDPVQWLGRLPLLSVFEIVMFILGAYFYLRHLKAARAKFIFALSLLAWLVIGVGGLASLSLIVPVVYLVVTTGIAYMLHEWFKVFPSNPLARWTGIAVIAIAILLTSLYQTRSYFVAWRYSPDTARVFTEKM